MASKTGAIWPQLLAAGGLFILWTAFIWVISAQNSYRVAVGAEAARQYSLQRSEHNCSPVWFILDECSPAALTKESLDALDLAAQNKMADWSAVMVGLSALGSLITLFGIVFVARTFDETRRANRLAKRASRLQLRAYLQVNRGRVVPANDGSARLAARVTLRNAGATPAHVIRSYIASTVGPEDPNWTPPEAAEELTHAEQGFHLAGGQKSRFSTLLPPGLHVPSEHLLYLFGYVVYADIFGREHTTHFTYGLRPPEERDGRWWVRLMPMARNFGD